MIRGEKAARGCTAGPLVRFDYRRFAADVARELGNRGFGAQARMCREAGVARRTVQNLLGTNQHPGRNPDTVLSIAAYLRLDVQAYCVWRDEEAPLRPFRFLAHGAIDWRLFAACVSMLCGGSLVELSILAGVSMRQAAHILAGEGCCDETFARLVRVMRLLPGDFHPGWRTQPRRIAVPQALAA